MHRASKNSGVRSTSVFPFPSLHRALIDDLGTCSSQDSVDWVNRTFYTNCALDLLTDIMSESTLGSNNIG